MITGKLINPRIIYKSGVKHSFDNTLVYMLEGAEIERVGINLPYDMPDPEIEVMVKRMIEEKAAEFESTYEEQELRWDWPEWDMGV